MNDISSRLERLNGESQKKLSKMHQDQTPYIEPEIEEALLEIKHLFDRNLITKSEYQALAKRS